MKIRTLLTIQAVMFIVAGLASLLLPGSFFGVFGASLDPAATAVARLYGATLLILAVIFWLGRGSGPSEARRAMLLGALLGNLVALVAGVITALAGTFNNLLWPIVVMWLFFTAAFGYFFLKNPDAM